jgi:glycosyltransferase involved in cell wall biosynthesis
MTAEVLFSYIIPTIGRDSLETAVRSVLSQDFPRAALEVVVVNDSGRPLPAADWQAEPGVRVIATNRSERSFARNSGAAVAAGRYLAFLDDDDWITPGALQEFRRLAEQHPRAGWLYGGIQVVDDQGRVLAEINSGLNGDCFAQIMGGAWAPLQSSLIAARAFFAAGGFNPRICGTEDEDLCRRIAFVEEFASTPAVVGVLFRGRTWSTSTNYLRAPEDTKISRDALLAQPGAARRLLRSARTSYWRGRSLRVALSTVPWNLKKRRIFPAASRALSSLLLLAGSGSSLFSADFWAGARADHVPESLHFVMKAQAQG